MQKLHIFTCMLYSTSRDLTSYCLISRVCAVAQYAVLESDAKVNRRGPFSHPTPPKPLNQFRCHVKYITTSPKRVDVQNLVGIDSAVRDLRMREKNTILCGFFLLTYLSICPFLRRGYRSQFYGDFNAQWLKRRDSATISAFWWSH